MINKEKILNSFNDFKDLKICIIGEPIIDEYIYVYALGTASKDPVLSTRKTNQERFAGGVLAVTNHVSDFVKKIHLVTLLGENNPQEDYINSHLSEKVTSKFFYKRNAETIIKTRFLEEKRLTKLFKYENSNGKVISNSLETEIKTYLDKNIKEYDIVIITDFGHGFFTKNLRKFITNNASFLALNVQTNSSNFGFNPLSKYDLADFVTMNQCELKMYFQNDECRKDHLLDDLIKTKKYKKILLTASKDGVLYYNGYTKFSHKAFNTRPLDTIGAGDAVFSISSLFAYNNDDEIIPEIANIVGGIAIETIGNKESVTKEKIINFLKRNGD